MEIQDAKLIHGDCREWLGSLPQCFRVDALITDPPYGVDFKGKQTKHTDAAGGYVGADSETIGPEIVQLALPLADRGVVFPGSRLMFSYPTPYEFSCVYCPSGAGLGRWGFTTSHPMLFYGVGLPHTRRSPAGFESFDLAGENRHPCPKPVRWMEWSVDKATLPGQTVLDPFMGSGTTGVACANLGRKFIGVEIEREYFDIACERIHAAYSQQRLFG